MILLINNWEYLRLQVFGHEFAILHYVGGIGGINGNVLQCRAAFESLIAQIRQAGWDIDRFQGFAATEDFIFFENLYTFWKNNSFKAPTIRVSSRS